MSWIIGYVGSSLSRDMRERLSAFGTDPRFASPGRTFFVRGGGLEETCRHGALSDDRGYWSVAGTGVRVDGDGSHLLTSSEWRRRMASDRPRLDELGGGFVALRWTTRQVEAFGDRFGIRSLFWLRLGDGVAFSTRMDWLAELSGGLDVEWSAFGSHWLTFNQLSHTSLVASLQRLGPAGYARLTPYEATSSSNSYAPDATDDAPEALLRALLRPDNVSSLSLGLSGGMDSRVLLALGHDRLSVHVFGSRSDADVRTAMEISEREGLQYNHFDARRPERDELLHMVRSHAVNAAAVSPASAALSLRYYPELHAQRKVVVDGAFGELLRRQFMNRLLRRARKAVDAPDASAAFPHLTVDRARVFDADCERTMAEGAQQDLLRLLESVAELDGLTVEDRVDILNVRTRLPNFFGYEQARLDGVVQSYMPFAHPRVVDAMLSLPLTRRRSGRAARTIIRSHAPRLTSYPLVKGPVAYPFALPSVGAAVIGALHKRFVGPTPSEDRAYVLGTLREFIQDRATSAATRHYDAYDPARLEQLVRGYYEEGKGAAQLDWWLAFELWRESIMPS